LDRRRSRRFPVVEIQKPTQALATNDRSRFGHILVITFDPVIPHTPSHAARNCSGNGKFGDVILVAIRVPKPWS